MFLEENPGFWLFWSSISQPDKPPLHSSNADLSKLLHITKAPGDSLLSSQILYFHLCKVQMGMYCKSSRLNSFVTKETSVEILLQAAHRDTEPYFTILPLTELLRNRWRRPTMSPECLCPIENGFYVECGSNGPGATKGLPCWFITPSYSAVDFLNFPTPCNISIDDGKAMGHQHLHFCSLWTTVRKALFFLASFTSFKIHSLTWKAYIL